MGGGGGNRVSTSGSGPLVSLAANEQRVAATTAVNNTVGNSSSLGIVREDGGDTSCFALTWPLTGRNVVSSFLRIRPALFHASPIAPATSPPLCRLDAFVMGAGTGGCLAGVSLFLRDKGSPAKIFLVDPPGSALFNRVRHGVCYSSQMSERDVKKHRQGRELRWMSPFHAKIMFFPSELMYFVQRLW